MKLREIKPNEVICCKTIEEMRELFRLTENFNCLNDVEYIWNYGSNDENHNKRRNCISFNHEGKRCGYCFREYYEGEGRTITDFSDLIIPELSAEEVLKICNDICMGLGCDECPMSGNCYSSDTADYKKIVEICEQWKADHEKKEPELEWVNVCRVIEVQDKGTSLVKKCVYEREIVGLPDNIPYKAFQLLPGWIKNRSLRLQ